MIHQIHLQRFTAFDDIGITFSPGINIIIGENGTGKTHLLKALYAACDVSNGQKSLAEKVTRVFLPYGDQIGRLIQRNNTSNSGSFEVVRKIGTATLALKLSCSNHTKEHGKAKVSGGPRWCSQPVTATYIPVKDMMANAPGFRSLYSLRHIHFEEIYADIIDRVFLGSLKGPADPWRKHLLTLLQGAMNGKVIIKNEEFFLKNQQGELEFTLLAEGMRKLGLLWVLIQNGTLLNGSVLLWDEPEANLNPKLMRSVVEILIALQRNGVQVFLAAHNYAVLKEFDLQLTGEDQVLFHSLYRTGDAENTEIQVSSTPHYDAIVHNSIDDTYGTFIDREIAKSMGGLGK